MLENYHVISQISTEPDVIFECVINPLIAEALENLKIIITSRHEPNWINNLKQSFILLSQQDLWFTPQEVKQFVIKLGFSQSGTDALPAALFDRHQGHPLKTHWGLATLAQQETLSVINLQDTVRDYVEIYLNHLAATEVGFILKLAILPTMLSPLCAAVIQSEDVTVQLRAFADEGLLIRRDQSSGHTVLIHAHEEVRRVLLALLHERYSQKEIYTLYSQAAAWLEQQDRVDEAIDLCQKGGFPQLAIDLVDKYVQQVIGRSELSKLTRWLAGFSEIEVNTNGILLLIAGVLSGYNAAPIATTNDLFACAYKMLLEKHNERAEWVRLECAFASVYLEQGELMLELLNQIEVEQLSPDLCAIYHHYQMLANDWVEGVSS